MAVELRAQPLRARRSTCRSTRRAAPRRRRRSGRRSSCSPATARAASTSPISGPPGRERAARTSGRTNLPEAGLGDHLAVAVGEAPAHVDRGRRPREGHALVRRVVDVAVAVGLRRGDRQIGVPHDDVGVRAGHQHALLPGACRAPWPGWSRAPPPSGLADAPLAPPWVHGTAARSSTPGAPLGMSVKSSRAQLLLLRVVERAVVGAEDVQVLRLQPVPERRLVASCRAAGGRARTSHLESKSLSRRLISFMERNFATSFSNRKHFLPGIRHPVWLKT